MRRFVLLVLVFGLLGGAQNARGQASGTSSAPPNPSAPAQTDGANRASWLFPVAKLDEGLPSWIRIGGEYRNRLEGPIGIGFAQTSDFYVLDRLRIRVAIQPKEWLGFQGEVQDSRIFFNHDIPNANPNEDTWTLWEAYAQVGNSTQGWADVVGGRKVLAFGDERVIGPSDWLNVGRTFDVARVDLHHPGYIVSAFASSVVPGENSDPHNALPGNNLFGVYGSFQNVVPKATFEPYVLWRVAPSNSALPETLGLGHLNEVTVGLHWKGTPPAEFDYDTEFDGQTGSLGQQSIGAWAGYIALGKSVQKMRASPRIFLEANYASGTKHPGGHTWSTFDQLYPSNHDKLGFADLVGRRNIVQFRTGVEERPTKKWILKQQFEGYWLATSNDNLYASSGAISVAMHPGGSRHVGNELDLVAEYTATKGLNFGFGYARLFAGQFLKTTTFGHDYSYPYAYLEYNLSRSSFHFPVRTNQPN